MLTKGRPVVGINTTKKGKKKSRAGQSGGVGEKGEIRVEGVT